MASNEENQKKSVREESVKLDEVSYRMFAQLMTPTFIAACFYLH